MLAEEGRQQMIQRMMQPQPRSPRRVGADLPQ
jgi:hypothetical protein